MNADIAKLTCQMDRRPPASRKALEEFFSRAGFTPPHDYLEFMAETDGSEGSIGDAYLAIFDTKELVDCNEQTSKLEPGIVFFATDRGGEAYGFEIDAQPGSIVAMEFADLDRARAKRMGRTLLEFLRTLSSM
jgi:hypothetical protein